ncbi:MAG: HupE/UreJ family protein [Bryobacteraceae bacterium]|nr:HupE/UreJ family protein [Bryobacteraceae bacterium]
MVSVSTSEARLEGSRLTLELRMPLYEAQHLAQPAALLDHMRFDDAKRLSAHCREIPADGAWRCDAVYEFPSPPDRFTVHSSLHSATVPNHVHVLRANRTGATAQAVLDLASPAVEVRFTPPGPIEIAVTRTASGVARTITPATLLFLAALALAARSRKELAALVLAFAAGQTAAALASPRLPVEPTPVFLESAAALATAYLAVEMIFLGHAGQRWLVVAILGLAQGFGFASFLRQTERGAGWLLAGALVAAAVLTILLYLLSRPLLGNRIPPIALLLAGLAWFVWRQFA